LSGGGPRPPVLPAPGVLPGEVPFGPFEAAVFGPVPLAGAFGLEFALPGAPFGFVPWPFGPFGFAVFGPVPLVEEFGLEFALLGELPLGPFGPVAFGPVPLDGAFGLEFVSRGVPFGFVPWPLGLAGAFAGPELGTPAPDAGLCSDATHGLWRAGAEKKSSTT
jgi:hypothetical protein